MLQNGMTIAKINCSKSSLEYHANIIDDLQAAIRKRREMLDICLPCAVALETCGPEICIGPLHPALPEGVELKTGEPVKIVFNEASNDKFSSEYTIFLSSPKLSRTLQEPINLIFIGDRKIVLSVKKHDSGVGELECTVVKEGILVSGMPVYISGITVDQSEKDEDDIQWGLKHGIDIVFATLTESAHRIKAIKKLLALECSHIKVFAKIENIHGWKNLEGILDAADGIFIDRDALSTSIPPQKMFSVQKTMISCCNKKGKPVIIGGQVMKSMLKTTQASRCESTDIFTAVLDGADCIELSAETAVGQYPKETTAMLSAICREAESVIPHSQIFLDLTSEVQGPLEGDHAAAISAVKAAIANKAKGIICITSTGKTAVLLSKYSPPCPVVAVTNDLQVAKEILLYRAIMPVVYEGRSERDWMLHIDNYLRHGVRYGMRSNFLKMGDSIIVISRWKNSPGFTDSFRIVVECVDRCIDK